MSGACYTVSRKGKSFCGVDTNPFGHYYYSKYERYILTKIGAMSSWFPYNMLIRSIAKGATKTEYAYENLYNSVAKLSKSEIIDIMDKTYCGLLEKKEIVKFDFPVLLVIGGLSLYNGVKRKII